MNVSNSSPITYRGTVYPWQCDHVGHMNVMWYIGKFDEATWHFLHTLGLSPSYLRNNSRGMAAVDQHVSYFRELRAGDIVTVRSTILEIGEKSVRFVHEMFNEETGDLVARTVLKGVHMDTVARKSCPFEDGILEKARSMLIAEQMAASIPESSD
ncbi:acyl-CoA thioesterase [Desulfatirhabdium butyrativorans]|uniref:acyl-CoA thioesterase n=1 Tax=Desulfatirhabdium butyrativorans TaxID=340467 RepID=UPI0004077A51|nr:thioesterase family protein [Desulfatirhabdium butyrativorans]